MIYNLLAVSLIAADSSVLRQVDVSTPSPKEADAIAEGKTSNAPSEGKMVAWDKFPDQAPDAPHRFWRSLSLSKADSEGKMFFWPIWTARSDIPFPTDQDSENKMFFWPIWTKSDAPLPGHLKIRLEEETSKADSESKMFFWPIWTARSDIPFPTEVDPDSEQFWTQSDSQV